MQAHYSVDSFSAAQFKTVAKNMPKQQERFEAQGWFPEASAAQIRSSIKEASIQKMAYCHKQLF